MFNIKLENTSELNCSEVVYYVRDKDTNKLITTFDSTIQKAEDIKGWGNFTAAQKLDLQNYITNLRFVDDKLQLATETNLEYNLFLPESFLEALTELYDQAKLIDINFNPMLAMLNGLLNHIIATEKCLSINNKPSVFATFYIDKYYDRLSKVHKNDS